MASHRRTESVDRWAILEALALADGDGGGGSAPSSPPAFRDGGGGGGGPFAKKGAADVPLPPPPARRVVRLGPPPPPPPTAAHPTASSPPPPSVHPRHAHYKGNAVKTAKYNALTFLPRFLFEMFGRSAYLYFLAQAALAYWSVVSPFAPWGSTLSLAFILLVAASKALAEDRKRAAEDRRTNNSPARLVLPDGRTRPVRWRAVRVGDVLEVRDGEDVPADLLLLSVSAPDNVCYVRTTNLDGESNLKVRRPADLGPAAPRSAAAAAALAAVLVCEPPNNDLHRFAGRLVAARPAGSPPGPPIVAPVTMDELLLRGCAVRNSGAVRGAVVYAGPDTRIQQNAASPPRKLGSFDRFLNVQIFLLLALQVSLCVALAFCSAAWRRLAGVARPHLALANQSEGNLDSPAAYMGMLFVSFWILLSYMVPISLFVTMEIVKFVLCSVYVDRDAAMVDPCTGEAARARNSDIVEDLGQVGHVFSDKTGTLTSNEMQLRAVAIKGVPYGGGGVTPGGGGARLEDTAPPPPPGPDGAADPAARAAAAAAAMEAWDPRLAAATAVMHTAGFWEEGAARGGSDAELMALPTSSPSPAEQSASPPVLRLASPRSSRPASPAGTSRSVGSRAGSAGGGGGASPLPSPSHPPIGGGGGGGGATRPWTPRGAGPAGPPPSVLATPPPPPPPSSAPSTSGRPPLPPGARDSAAAAAAAAAHAAGGGAPPLQPPSGPAELAAAVLGHHVLDFWTNVCLCHSLIVERPGDGGGEAGGGGGGGRAAAAAAGASPDDDDGRGAPLSPRGAPPSPPSSSDGASSAQAGSSAAAATAAAGPAPPPTPTLPSYQGPSPDEVALADAARRLGFEFVGRTRTSVALSIQGHAVTHDLLNVLDFTSERARMSVIARSPDGTIRLYAKGSDAALLPRLRPGTDGRLLAATHDNLRSFSVQGLRTLLLASRVIPEAEWAAWNATYQAAASSMAGREAALAAAAEAVERDLELVGVTAIEDKLQEGVPEAVATLIDAGIKVWMITGDKQETAINIAISCGLVRSHPARLLRANAAGSSSAAAACLRALLDATGGQGVLAGVGWGGGGGGGGGSGGSHAPSVPATPRVGSAAGDLPAAVGASPGGRGGGGGGVSVVAPDGSPSPSPSLPTSDVAGDGGGGGGGGPPDRPELVIDGRTLGRVLGTPAEALLAELAVRCAAVIVCRASPSQKAGIVDMMRRRRLREQLAAAGVALPPDGSLPSMSLRARAGRWARHPLRTLATRAATDTQRLLAIGDGANDVAMIQAADIGVGLLGREGRQAANNADFAFGRFRALTRLLLVHGTLADYRLARLIKYSFYKNIAFASIFFCFQFFNGFSGQALLDGVTSAFYNAFFTALPAGVLAALDRPVRRLATLEAHPRAYNARPALTARAFWRTAVLAGALQGAVVFFVPYLGQRVLGGRPALDDVWALGKTMFIAVIGVVTLEAALVCRYWTWPFALVLWGSYLATWPWLALLPLLYRAAGRVDIAQYGVGEALLRSPIYWAELGLVYAITFSARLAEHGANWIGRPRDDMVLAEMEAVDDGRRRVGGGGGQAAWWRRQRSRRSGVPGKKEGGSGGGGVAPANGGNGGAAVAVPPAAAAVATA